ncbi:hypothetical protein ACA910_018371 [Epithemia clementina (nom. ined.)]
MNRYRWSTPFFSKNENNNKNQKDHHWPRLQHGNINNNLHHTQKDHLVAIHSSLDNNNNNNNHDQNVIAFSRPTAAAATVAGAILSQSSAAALPFGPSSIPSPTAAAALAAASAWWEASWQSSWLASSQSWQVVHEWQEESYCQALALKCPFLRRRASDALDWVDHALALLWNTEQQVRLIRTTRPKPWFLTATTATSTTTSPNPYNNLDSLGQPQKQQPKKAWIPIAWRNSNSGQEDDDDDEEHEHEPSSSVHHHHHHPTKKDRSKSNRPPAVAAATKPYPPKSYHLSTKELMNAIRADWKAPGTTLVNHKKVHKGYYITGRLNTTLYQDDCWFDGPDPDLPIHGLRKYARAAAQLFCPKHSWAELISLQAVANDHHKDNHHDTTTLTLVATWRLQGRLRLPWQPQLPLVQGTTTYQRHAETGLIARHVETWDNLTAWQAFVRTFLLPQPKT